VNESASIIDKLHHVLEEGDGLADRLERSLVEAHARAQSELNPAVFDALDWPTDLAAYERYLQGFLRWIPQQSDAQAWKQPAPKERFAKEVSVRLGLLLPHRPEGRRRLGDRGEQRGLRQVADRLHP